MPRRREKEPDQVLHIEALLQGQYFPYCTVFFFQERLPFHIHAIEWKGITFPMQVNPFRLASFKCLQ